MASAYKISFKSNYDPVDISNLLRMARMSVEALHGQTNVSMQCHHEVRQDGRVVIVSTDAEIGRDVAAIFISTAQRILGEDCCSVSHCVLSEKEVVA